MSNTYCWPNLLGSLDADTYFRFYLEPGQSRRKLRDMIYQALKRNPAPKGHRYLLHPRTYGFGLYLNR
jgi:hypothetical protein